MSISNRNYIIIILILIIVFHTPDILSQSIKFNHLTIEDGLSNNDVNTMIQDQIGFLWFATEDGLNRYDGYNFKIFRNNPDDITSISDNSIWSLIEDRKGNIWIGTKGGFLNKFNPNTEKFYRWKIKSRITEENSIKALYEDYEGNIWIGTYKDGLYRLNIKTNKIDHWNFKLDDDQSISHNYVQAISQDNDGNILIGTYIGFNIFNPKNEAKGFKRYFYEVNNEFSLSNNLIWALSKSTSDSNVIWIGTYDNLTEYNSETAKFKRIKILNPNNLLYGTGSGSVIEEVVDGENIIWTDSYAGLLKINLNSGKTTRFNHDENDLNSLISNQINKIYTDKSGVMWVTTENGISYVTQKSTSFNSLSYLNSNPILPAFFSKKNITAINSITDDLIWIGSTDGLYSIENLKTNPKLKIYSKFKDTHIWSIASTEKNGIWIGTFGKGLKQFDPKLEKITDWNLDNPRIRTESIYYNKALMVDNRNNIWVGYWGVGLARINPNSHDYDVWLNEPNNDKSLSYNDVWVIKEDKFGRVWLGTTGGGLNLFEDKDGGIFHHWTKEENNIINLSSNNIYSICESRNGKISLDKNITVLWIGTGNGINQFVIRNKKDNKDIYDFDVEINSFTVNDGLPDNSVNSILEDENGNLWLGTGSGISFFDVTKKSFNNYSAADGLNGTVINFGSSSKMDSGEMLFGSTKGLNIFDPKKIYHSDYLPPVVITDFQIFNQSIKTGKDSPLKQSITNAKEIVLPYNQNVFSFEFAALDYNSSESIRYSYKMEGFDKEWVYSGKRRFVTYTNLDPGEYEFKVKSTNADGIWNDNLTSINIVMTPPWWKTLWAYGLYAVLIFLGLFGIRQFEISRTKLRNELKLREIEVRNKSELEEVKSRFFANLSHEFRTPLMLIKGPLEQLKNNVTNNVFSESIDLIDRNSDRLKELIDQLLELSQLEKAAIPLKAKQINLIAALKGLLASFDALAKQKNISLTFESDLDSETCWIDRDKFEKIINNLLSNAFKFTPQNGNILVSVKKSLIDAKQFAEIKISDNGVGISKDKIDKIFDRFFQVDDSDQRSYGGSGIGLALVKEFIDLHKWKIFVESEEGKGTHFKIQIPMWNDYLDANEKIYTESVETLNVSDIKIPEQEKLFHPSNIKQKHEVINNTNNKPSLLIVDDSEDVRKYLSSLLENDFNISEAENGEEGIKVASEINPDLIISDVMMPSMDGMEFCSKIKSNWMTSDIPVILLTAKASVESKLEGLEIGADDYLTKPFDSRELFARIKNLLEQRKRLRDKYNKNLDLLTETSKLNAADSEFINKTLDLLEKNIDKTNFGTEQLAKELFVSRTQLHRKIMTITGQPPGEFVRIFKLKRAAQLLLDGKFSVTQVAYEIGFSSPAQFTRAFTKQFDCVPSEFSSRQKSSN